MEIDLPVLIMCFIRPDLLRKSLGRLANFKPPILYVVCDGPRNRNEENLCQESREIAMNPGWDCEIIPIFTDENYGIVTSFVGGMNRMFKEHEFGLFVEDDVLLSKSFYQFAKEMLIKYRESKEVGHINASNFIPEFKWENKKESYLFSSLPHVWGFATWRRMWNLYDVNMPAWKKINQKKFLKKYFYSSRERKSLKNLFDLHCENPNPWACDYQWIFNCLHNNAFSITPRKNMSRNIGFDRPDSTHTKSINPHDNELEECDFPLSHPREIKENLKYNKALSYKLCPPTASVITGKIKSRFQNIFFGQK